MDSRGHGHGRRTRYRPDRWTPGSVATVVTSLIAAGAFLTAAFTGAGGLHPSTFPIEWPEADPLLLAAIGGLLVPAFLPRPRIDAGQEPGR
jgi:energy-coupling factor transport system permease protein